MGRRDFMVTPSEWLPRGEALCTTLPRPTAIWQGIPGEEAVVHVYHVGQNNWLGRWKEATGAPHPLRVEPPCDRYSPCGGCPLMHLRHDGQVRARRALIRGAFESEGLPTDRIGEMITFPEGQQEFRHVAKLAAGLTEIGHVRLGAFGRNSRDVIPIPNCLVVTPLIRRCMKSVSHHVIELDIRPFDTETGEGLLRYAVIRQSRFSGDALITLVAAHRSPLLDQLAEEIGRAIPEVVGIHLHVNDGPGNAIFLRDGEGILGTRLLVGRPTIEERLEDVRFFVGSGDFFQTNPAMAERMYHDIVEALRPGRPLVDLYCGVGAITLLGARKAGWSLGVEEIESSVLRARENASLNGISAEFTAGRVEEVIPTLRERVAAHRPNVVVDPARRGLEDGVIDAIHSLDPGRVVYVSCNPRALARDLSAFTARGYSLTRVTPYDMFPQTAHVEVVAELEPSEPPTDQPARLPRRRRIGAI